MFTTAKITMEMIQPKDEPTAQPQIISTPVYGSKYRNEKLNGDRGQQLCEDELMAIAARYNAPATSNNNNAMPALIPQPPRKTTTNLDERVAMRKAALQLQRLRAQNSLPVQSSAITKRSNADTSANKESNADTQQISSTKMREAMRRMK